MWFRDCDRLRAALDGTSVTMISMCPDSPRCRVPDEVLYAVCMQFNQAGKLAYRVLINVLLSDI